MRFSLRLRLLCALLPGVLLLTGCPPVGDDDDVDATTPDATATPEFTPTPDVGDDDSDTPGIQTPVPTSTLAGMVTTVNRTSG